MTPTDELKELAQELCVTCNTAVAKQASGECDVILSVAQAKAKGELLLHKLGRFGSIWAKAFEPAKNEYYSLRNMLGAATVILEAITKGRLSTIEERISAAFLGDLMEQAEVLIEGKFFLAAAVVLRAVLEERLRKLCEVHNLPLPVSKPTMEHFKQALAAAEVIDNIVAKNIDWMASVGNAAAHKLETFKPGDVPALYRLMLDFLAKFSL